MVACPVARFHSRMMVVVRTFGRTWPGCRGCGCASLVARVRPFGLNATDWTLPVNPVRVVICPVAMVHSETVPSESAMARVCSVRAEGH